MTNAPMNGDDHYRLHRRFDRMGRLVGDSGMAQLFDAHVMVVGIGGVGSFAAEALARSGVGRLTLVDFDRVCSTNTNRQLHALQSTVGKPKAQVMAERLAQVNPDIRAEGLRAFYNHETSEALLSTGPDWVVDAIDNVTAKCHLLATCRGAEIPIVCSTGAAARLDPTQIRVDDLSQSRIDPLARAVRRILRQKYGFAAPEEGEWGIPAVFSIEPAIEPRELHYDGGKGFRCVCPHGGGKGFHECEKRNRIDGTSPFVVGAFGLACASIIVRALTAKESSS